jgi:hypothetical protein
MSLSSFHSDVGKLIFDSFNAFSAVFSISASILVIFTKIATVANPRRMSVTTPMKA